MAGWSRSFPDRACGLAGNFAMCPRRPSRSHPPGGLSSFGRLVGQKRKSRLTAMIVHRDDSGPAQKIPGLTMNSGRTYLINDGLLDLVIL